MRETLVKRWLVASLVLNLFLAGGIAGGAWRWWTAAPPQPRGLRFAADELTAEQRQEFRSGLREARRDASVRIQAGREGRQEVFHLLSAPEFDRAALSAVLARTREADTIARARFEGAVVDFAATLSAEDRQKLAQGLARRTALAPPPPPPGKP